MGNFEKLVVLVVLFLSAVVLAVSLSEGEAGAGESPATAQVDPPEKSAPKPAAPKAETITTPAPRKERETPAAAARTESRPGLLLDAAPEGVRPRGSEGVRPKAPAPQPSGPAPSNGPVTILKDEADLTPSFDKAYRQYVVRENDTWAGLAQRFYEDVRRVDVLQVTNEDLTDLTVGATILVPVYDLSREARERDRLRPYAREASAPVESAPLANTSSVEPGERYTVVAGDSLSKIALKVLGDAGRWAEIYEANKAVMRSADWLTVGMELYIPRAGEVVVPPIPASEPAPVATSPSGDEPRVR